MSALTRIYTKPKFEIVIGLSYGLDKEKEVTISLDNLYKFIYTRSSKYSNNSEMKEVIGKVIKITEIENDNSNPLYSGKVYKLLIDHSDDFESGQTEISTLCLYNVEPYSHTEDDTNISGASTIDIEEKDGVVTLTVTNISGKKSVSINKGLSEDEINNIIKEALKDHNGTVDESVIEKYVYEYLKENPVSGSTVNVDEIDGIIILTVDDKEVRINNSNNSGLSEDDIQNLINSTLKDYELNISEDRIEQAVYNYMLENPVSDGADGEKGEKGDPGADGITPVFSIGTIETLPPGSEVTVSITGTASNPVLNLGIPKGEPGDGGNGASQVVELSETDEQVTITVTSGENVNSVTINKEVAYSLPVLEGQIYEDDDSIVKPMYYDIHVIPDKHNTGCDEATCIDTLSGGETECGIVMRLDTTDKGEWLYIDLNSAPNKTMEGEYIFENLDLSGYWKTGIGNPNGYQGAGLKIIYNNCKFTNWVESYGNEKVKVEFNNCSFSRFSGYDSEFNNCYFGGGDLNGDPMNPQENCTFNNCYCSDCVIKTEEQGSAHIDGMQSNKCKNLYFNNCRWEVPDINYTYKQGGFSYVIYIEPRNGAIAENVVADHCHLNGGGYYSIGVTGDVDLAKNVKIVEPFIGYCYYGSTPYYPSPSKSKEAVTDAILHDSLYVSSVWKDDNNYLHFLVTNDTGDDRTLTVYTNKGVTTFEVPRTYKMTEYEADTKDFDDLPIDIEHVIEVNVDYAIFYEGSTQIRYVNYENYLVRKPILDNSGSGKDGVTPNITIGTVETLPAGSQATANITGTTEAPVLNLGIPKGADGENGKDGASGGNSETQYRWQYVGEIHPNSMYNYKTKAVETSDGSLYSCVHYIFNGEKKIRFSGATSGGSTKLAYAFVDKDGNIIKVPEFVKGETYADAVIDVPENAYEVYINGNNYYSAHLEVAVEDLRADMKTLQYLLKDFGKRLQYKDTFAWKPMDTGYIAFTFDDSLDDVASVVDLFISKGVPCCFGAIPEKLNMGLPNGETVAQAMQRGVDAVGCEVLAHGSSSTEIVDESNIDDMDFLYNKFVVNKHKLIDFGFNIRGTVRVGGTGNICGDPRTDEWVRLFFDYSDLYGIEEPYSHARVSLSTGIDGYKEAIDKAITNKTFAPILFHGCPDYMEELIDYVISNGGKVCNYATVYDTFGSTAKEVELESKVKALEENSSNTPEKGVDYWTETDKSDIKSYCKDYIDSELLGGES